MISNKKLHEVIVEVLEKAEKPISVKNISDIIKNNGLWLRPIDGKAPEPEQISARINNYKHLFIRENGVVQLKSNGKLQKRLLRLTWNDKGWENPCGHEWRKSNQGNSNIAFENQYGFGGEEWLFNPRYQKDGYQYGYIRSVINLSETIEFIDEAYLFTIKQKTSERFLVGIIKQLEIIIDYEPEAELSRKLYEAYLDDMKEELKTVKADIKGLDVEGFIASVKFKVEGNELFEEPINIPGLKGKKYNRFQPYIIDEELEKIFEGYLPKNRFEFKPGVAKNTGDFEKNSAASTKIIVRLHSDITNSLVNYLGPDFTVKKGNLSVENTRFGNNIADVVLKHSSDVYTLLEVKTSLNIRKNIREALGQLIDYAFWYKEIFVKELVIVSPSELEEDELNYFIRIKNSLNIKLNYWQYVPNTKKGEESFIKIFV